MSFTLLTLPYTSLPCVIITVNLHKIYGACSSSQLPVFNVKSTGSFYSVMCFFLMKNLRNLSQKYPQIPLLTNPLNPTFIIVFAPNIWDTVTSYYISYLTQTFNNIIFLLFDLSKNCWMSGKQWRPWSDTALCGVWSGSSLFAQACLSQHWAIPFPVELSAVIFPSNCFKQCLLSMFDIAEKHVFNCFRFHIQIQKKEIIP